MSKMQQVYKYTMCRTTIHPILINSLLAEMISHKHTYKNIYWQSRVENVHYYISVKIEFNAGKYAPSHYQCGSRSLAPL